MKRVKPHGLRQSRGVLIVPVRDVDGELHGLQFIRRDGQKVFLTGTAKCGKFFLLGDLAASVSAPLAIAEGWFTSATVHEATGWPTAAAFDAGNLEPVAVVLAAAYPDRRIVVAADNDRETPGNPGLTKGRAAAAAVGELLIFPNFGPGATSRAASVTAACCGSAWPGLLDMPAGYSNIILSWPLAKQEGYVPLPLEVVALDSEPGLSNLGSPESFLVSATKL